MLRLDFECLESIPGGINEVRLRWDNLLNCHRVGKRIDISGLEHDEVLPEPATLQMIDHKNVLPVVAAAVVDGYEPPLRVIEVVTPYLPRGSVTDALLRGEQFTATEAVGILQAVLRGLGALHESHGIAHRDIKSGNVLLADDYTVAKVADLGLAGLFDGSGNVPAVNNPTLYSPPELVTTGVLTRASDLFPLGLILRELLGGAFPYASYSTTMMVSRLMRGLSPLKSQDLQLPIWTPRSLRRIVSKVSRKYPSERFQTTREMDDALAGAVVADWAEVDDGAWEAPFKHRRDLRVRVESTRGRSNRLRLATKVDRGSGWRRIVDDTDVANLRSVQAQLVFDHATEIATAR